MRTLLTGLLSLAAFVSSPLLVQAQSAFQPQFSPAQVAQPLATVTPAKVAQTKPAAAPAAPNLTGLVLLKEKSLPFSVGLPHNWQSLNLQDGMGGVSISSRKQPPFSMIRLLYLPKQARSIDLHGEFASFEEALRASGVTVQKRSEKPLNCGGLDGVLRQYDLSSKAGSMVMKVWFGAGARNFYSFQLTSPPSSYATDSAMFDRVLASIDF